MSRYSRERWARLTDLLGEALQRQDREARRLYLEDACADDPTLIAEVEALVEAHEQAERENRFEDGALDIAPVAFDEATTPPEVGPYRLVRRIGRGGMSSVWLAERADGLFDQRVAVKMLQAGYLPKERQRRFEAERRILASLQHPNIARLLDGGVTKSGQPYLVMEYVEGTPVTEFCTTGGLGIDERLRLFRTICDTVAFAHRNLVVHRDLKPSNIFVTADGTVKLLDFGIAKLIGDEAAAVPDEPLTRTGQILLTPEYAAPEQVASGVVTTATDVYSLGIVLYELMVRRRPYEVPDRAPSAMERTILESRPERPSTAVRTVPAKRPPAASASTTERLARRLRGDLDTIVLMAIRKEPERRYGTAAELAEDLGRFVEGLPVRAQPDTATYRVSKFVKRHRGAVAVSFVVFLVAAAGVISVARQSEVARAEAARAEALNDYLLGMLAAVDPTEEGRDVRVADLLDRAADDLDARFRDQPEVDASVRHTLGRVYTELGLYAEASALVERALRGRVEALGPRHRDAIESRSLLGRIRVLQGDYPAADSILTETLALAREGLPDADSLFIDVHSNLGYAAYVLGNYEASETHHRAVVAALEQREPRNELEIASALGNVAIVQADLGKLEEATAVMERQVRMYRAELGEDNSRLGRALANLGSVYYDRYMGEEAVLVLTEAVDILRRTLGERNTETGWALGSLGSGLTLLDRDAQADSVFRASLDIYRATLGEDHPRTAGAELRLGRHLFKRGLLADSEPHAERALDIWRSALPADHPAVGEALLLIGDIHAARGDCRSAEPYLREAHEVRRAGLPANHPDVAEAGSMLGACLGRIGRLEEAEELLSAGFTALRDANGIDHETTQQARMRYAEFCLDHSCEDAQGVIESGSR